MSHRYSSTSWPGSRLRTGLVALAVAALALPGASPAAAAAAPPTFTVTTAADGGAGSLREAVRRASAAGAAAAVQVPAGTYPLTVCGADDAGAAGDLDLDTAATVTVGGPAPSRSGRPAPASACCRPAAAGGSCSTGSRSPVGRSPARPGVPARPAVPPPAAGSGRRATSSSPAAR
jgi:hypothetical protein